jgi:UDP-2-acetamido-3-amino-2,3-dideoxy-glucuronate N-acetyltransferase
MRPRPGIDPAARIHPTAIVEDGVVVGPGTAIWDNVHVRRGATIGRDCILGEKTYIAYDTTIGDYVKLGSNVHICPGVTIQDFCMVSMHTVFTNDTFPRAGNLALSALETSEPTERTLRTIVRRGATIGANATIGPGIELGEFCLVGMGSVVTQTVAPHLLVAGNPARFQAWVCACGDPLARKDRLTEGQDTACGRCRREFRLEPSGLKLIKDYA